MFYVTLFFMELRHGNNLADNCIKNHSNTLHVVYLFLIFNFQNITRICAAFTPPCFKYYDGSHASSQSNCSLSSSLIFVHIADNLCLWFTTGNSYQHTKYHKRKSTCFMSTVYLLISLVYIAYNCWPVLIIHMLVSLIYPTFF